MRFMFIVKSAHRGPPSPELMEAMHKLADREIKAGRLIDTGVLTREMRMYAGGQQLARIGLDSVDSAFPYSLTTAPVGSARSKRMMLAARPVDNLSDMMVDPIPSYGITVLPSNGSANASPL